MARVRMTGLASGLDTESMVKELVNASSTKVNDAKKDKQKLEWKKEAWQDLNTKLYNFYKNDLYSFRMSGTYNKKTTSISDDSKVSVTAGNNTTNGTHTISVKQIASSAYLTGANIKKADNSYTTVGDASATTKFSDMTDADGASLDLEGKTISLTSLGDEAKTVEFTLGGEGENSVSSLKELNDKLAADENFKGLQASMKDGKITFTNSSLTKAEDGTESGTSFVVTADALGVNGIVDYKADEESGKVTSLSGVDADVQSTFTSADINGGTKLSDLGIAVGTSFKINDKEFVVDDKTTITSFTEGLSKLGVKASFDSTQGRFYINSTDSGAANDFTLTSSDANALEILGLGSAATKIDAQDAIIDYNGVEYRGASNQFNINGMSIVAKSVTGDYNKETGEFTNDKPISVNVVNDTDGVYNSVKNFVKKYNELIDEMNKLYNEEVYKDYEPLTDDERSAMSDTQIEKWEEKAKSGLLRRDSTVNSLLSNMRSILSKAVTVTNDDGTTTQYTLASLGITTGSDWTEGGKLHIMGDEDDAAYASEPNKLREALNNKPEIFSKVFAGSDGLGSQLYDYMGKAMKKTETSHSLTFYDDISMDEDLDDYDDKIDKLNEKLTELEDRYYDQFAKMESAMAKLQQQQSYLASLMGTA